MMKTLLLLILMAVPFFAQSQIQAQTPITAKPPTPTLLTADSVNNRVKYEVIVEQPGTKDILYAKGKNWVAKTYKNNSSVVDLADSVSGNIFINASTETNFNAENTKVNSPGSPPKRGMPVSVSFECRMYFRDNKYRVVIDNLKTKPRMGTGMQIDKAVLDAAIQENSPAGKEAKQHVSAGENAVKKILASLNATMSSQ
jgi:hypothetical protein